MKSHRSVIDREGDRSGQATLWGGGVYVVSLAMLGALVAVASGHRGDSLVRLAIFGAFAALFIAWVSIALHELGHAVASTLVGGPVHQVRIGAGPLLRIHRAFGTTVVLRLLPTYGCTVYGDPSGTAVRARLIVRTSAGVIVNGALIGVALTMLSGYWTLMIVWVNGFMILDNLLPHTARTAEGSRPTDGLVLLRLLRMSA